MAEAYKKMGGRSSKGVKPAISPGEIPPKRYFTIGEVSKLCGVKPHVLRYWEEEFEQLKPVRRSNRRYYQRSDVLLLRQIRDLLYQQGYTIGGARKFLADGTDKPAEGEEVGVTRELISELITELEELCSLLK